MKENDEFILDIKRLGINGEGIGYYNKLAVFVKNAIPKEGVDVVVTKVLNKMAFANIKEIKKESIYRVKPKCVYYDECGACQTMHIKYDKNFDYKKDLVIESLTRYTSINIKSFEIRNTLFMDDPFNYRNKSLLVVRKVNGLNTIAMIKENSNITFKIDTCLTQLDEINKINKKIIDLSNSMNIKSFPEKDYSLRYLLTRYSKETNESLVCLVVKELNDEMINFARRINQLHLATSIYINVSNDLKSHEILTNDNHFIGGKEYIKEKIGNLEFLLYPNTFFQLNTKGTNILYEQIKKACKLSHKEVVLDGYCGVGSIALYLSNLAKEVIGIEINGNSIYAATNNAKINKIKNAKFYQGDCLKLMPKILKDKKIDVLVLDPPRTGLGLELINVIKESKINRLVYVSCNHATLAKDLEILKDSYNIHYIQPVDMFPNTIHVECVCSLSLKK